MVSAIFKHKKVKLKTAEKFEFIFIMIVYMVKKCAASIDFQQKMFPD